MNDIKIGDKIRCVVDMYPEHLTLNKIYTVMDINGFWIGVICNYPEDEDIAKGKANWGRCLFEKVKYINIPIDEERS